MRKLYFLQYCIFAFVLGLKSIESSGQSTSTTDYFRSAQSGLWDVANTWESSPDSNNWVPSALAPTSEANTITIQSGDSVTISNSTTIDQVEISGGGLLDVSTVPLSVLTINNGQGPDVVRQNGGVFRHNDSVSGITILSDGGSFTVK